MFIGNCHVLQVKKDLDNLLYLNFNLILPIYILLSKNKGFLIPFYSKALKQLCIK